MDIQDPVELARSIIKAHNEAPEDGRFEEGHPIFCMAQEIVRLNARARELEEALRYCRGRLVYHGRGAAIHRIDITLDNSEKAKEPDNDR